MRPRTKRLMRLLAAGAAMAATLVLAPMPAVADTLPSLRWPAVALDDLPNASHLISNPAGGVTVGCSDSSTQAATKSFDAAGTVVQSWSAGDQPRLFTCAGSSVVGSDGTLYTAARVSDGGEHEQQLRAYQGDTLLWSYTASCGVHASISSMTTGFDGNLYFLLSGGGGSAACSATQLIGLAPTLQPGETTPATVVSTTLPGYATGLAAYGSGLVVRSTSGIEHLDYSGQPYQSGPNPINQVQYRQTPDPQFDATMDGRVFLPVPANGGEALGCANPSTVISTIDAYDQTGRQFSAKLPACAEVVATRAFYNGGFVAQIRVPRNPAVGPLVDALVAFGPGGNGLWTLPLVSYDGQAKSYDSTAFATDLNGNVAVQRTFTFADQQPNGQLFYYPGIQLRLLSGNSGAEASATIELSGTHNDGYGYRPTNPGEVTIAKGTAYFSATKCYSTSACDTAHPQLYAAKLPGLQMDYPRGALLSAAQPMLNYVAMGDSFSSGEGVPPFEAGTDTDSSDPTKKDMCHRSYGAYPRLLSGDPVHRLALQSFVACSGATTDNVINGQDAEGPQIEALSSSTDVATLTVGGDDIDFNRFVRACVNPVDDCSGAAHDEAISKIKYNLPVALNKAFAAIKGSIGDQTRVLVVGYPMMIPDSTLTLPNCLYLTRDERIAARDVVTRLNAALQDAVKAANSVLIHQSFEYVDPTVAGSPFAGHELCTESSYFNGLTVPATSYSFHPNAQGQAAYWRLIQNYLG